MNDDYCPFCACYVDEELDYDDLMNYTLAIGSGHNTVDFGKFDIWIGRNGELSAGFHTNASDYIDIMRKKINFCPICGKHLVEKGAEEYENCIFRIKEVMIRNDEFVCSDLFGYYSTRSAAKSGIEQRIDFRTKNCDCDYSILYANDIPRTLCFKPDENGNSDGRLDYYIVEIELDEDLKGENK